MSTIVPPSDRDALPVLLVHGAWTGAWVWKPVQRHLRRMGIDNVAVSLPSQVQVTAALAADVRAIEDGLSAIGRPALVVAHSYGGVPVSQVAESNPLAARLIFIAAAMADVGESTLSLLASDPDPSRWLRFLIGTRPGRRLLDLAGIRARIRRRPDVREEVFVLAASPAAAGWRTVPSTYVVLTRDLIFSVALQRRIARRANDTVEVAGHHVAVWFKARTIAALIGERARNSGDI